MIHNVPYGIKVSVSIEYDNNTDTKHIRVICPMYMSKEFMLGHSYSGNFTDGQILNDRSFVTAMINRFPSV